MKKYAIIQLQGKQYKVSEGDKLVIDRLETKEGNELEVNEVLLLNDGKTVKIGTPLLKGAKLKFKVLSHDKAKKIRVAKFKAKSRYRKVKGHRQAQSTLELLKIV
ncbi:MAG: 50S ribosomal protein L21 [Candidatus Woesebacteria bacterium]|jgi:large subunit ribosomal protein L21